MTTPDRFWDVFATAEDGWYDFAGAITLQAIYTATRMSEKLPDGPDAPAAPTIAVQLPIPTGKGVIRAGDLPAELPPRGYVASPIKIGDIKAASRDPATARLVKWVSDTDHVGKIRINCHGDPEGGMMFMNSPNRPQSACLFMSIASWLALNGLQDVVTSRRTCRYFGLAHGLSTITLAVCHSAKPREETAATKNHLTETRSGVEQVAQTLLTLGYEGIEVTGHVAPFAGVLSDLALTNFAAEAAMATADEHMGKWVRNGPLDGDAIRALVADAIVRCCDHVSFDKKGVFLARLNDGAASPRDVLIAAYTEHIAAPQRKKLAGGDLTPGQIAVHGEGDRYVRFARHPTKTKMIL